METVQVKTVVETEQKRYDKRWKRKQKRRMETGDGNGKPERHRQGGTSPRPGVACMTWPRVAHEFPEELFTLRAPLLMVLSARKVKGMMVWSPEAASGPASWPATRCYRSSAGTQPAPLARDAHYLDSANRDPPEKAASVRSRQKPGLQ